MEESRQGSSVQFFEPSESSSVHNSGARYRTLTRSKSTVFLPRLIKRNLSFHQSMNRFSVRNINGEKQLLPLLTRDWFHVLLRFPFYISMIGLLSVWVSAILVWAGLYVYIDNRAPEVACGLGDVGMPIQWATAFAFSLETCTTVGYGLPGSTNAFFEANCPSVQILIFFQMTWSMMFNAFLFAFFYTSLSKCESRGLQVVFGNKIIVKEDPNNGNIIIGTRVYDVDAQYPVVEAHLRMYVIDRRMKMHPLRIQEPDDDMGATLHTSVPWEVRHHVDHHSALCPRMMPLVRDPHGLFLRSSDSAVGNREEIECPVCGETYGTYAQLERHINFQKIVEEHDAYPVEGTHRGFKMPKIRPISLQEVKTYIENFMSEIIVVAEGIDPQVSGTFQALQSYKYEDIAWEGEFEPCLVVRKGEFCVDLAKFHQVRMPMTPPSSDKDSDSESGIKLGV